jgi:hypothetical protein
MGLSLTKASQEVGITKAGLVKAIKKGRLSAEKNSDGEWVVEPVELFRVYPQVKPVSANQQEEVGVGIATKNNGLEREVELLRERLSHADENNAKLMKMLDEQISTVRVLTDQRQGRDEKKGFWKRMFG